MTKSTEIITHKVIIIGEGPAGMSAALYLKRANIDVIILEKATPGGKLIWTSSVENYPGFKTASGVELASIMHQQLKDNQIKKSREEVLDIVKQEDGKFFIDTNKHCYVCDFVIFAAGTKVRKLNIDREMEFIGNGVSYCAMCDGPQYEDLDVCVIGGGNSGFEEALYLSKICKTVTIVSRSDHFRADPIIVDKALSIPNIKVLQNKLIEDFVGDNEITGLKVRDKITDKISIIKTSGIFIYIGFDPTSGMLQKFDCVDEKGYIICNDEMETKVPGLFAAGDCVKKSVRQVITAVADGVVAAAAITRKI